MEFAFGLSACSELPVALCIRDSCASFYEVGVASLPVCSFDLLVEGAETVLRRRIEPAQLSVLRTA